jgi:parallel beta-helix repeat protein
MAPIPLASAATTNVVCVNTGDLQAAVNAAAPFDTLNVSGNCDEEFLAIRSDRNGLILDGGRDGVRMATIKDRQPGGTTITVRGAHQVRIRNFANITSNTTDGTGVYVVDGGTAQILNNGIRDNLLGVLVSRNAQAIINDNTIENNTDAGVRITETSSARIGYTVPLVDPVAAPNTIQGNGFGVQVSRGASARIVANNISNNDLAGIRVERGSQADVASNTIQHNVNGVELSQNSSVVLGNDTGSGPLNSPNSGHNIGFGVLCGLNSSVDGRRGTLDGTIRKVKIEDGCIDSTRP